MKNFKLILSAVSATLLLGCSDLSVDENEALAENFPQGFEYKDYMKIHPALRHLQIKADVDEHNAAINAVLSDVAARTSNVEKALPNSIKKSKEKCENEDLSQADRDKACAEMEKDQNTLAVKKAELDSVLATPEMEAYKSDTSRFFSDSLTLYSLYTNPYIGGVAGYTADNWLSNWNRPDTVTTKDTITHLDTLKLVAKKTIKDGDSTKTENLIVYMDRDLGKGKITYNADSLAVGKLIVTQFEGYTDTTYETAAEPVVLSEDIVLNKLATGKKEVLDSVKVTVTITPTVGLALDKKTYIAKFNYYDDLDAQGQPVVVDDTLKLASVPMDSNAISFHYVMFGKVHGWAYRYCKDSELKNTRGCEDDYSLCDNMEEGAAKNTCYSLISCDMYPTNDLYCFDSTSNVSRIIK